MPITFLGSDSASRAGSTVNGQSLSLTGLGLQEGDIVIASVVAGSTADLSIGIDTAGYTTVGTKQYANDTYDVNMLVGYKFMGPTPDTAVVSTPSKSTSAAISISYIAFRGVDTTTPIDVAAVIGTKTNTAIPFDGSTDPTITPTSSGAVIVASGGAAHARSTAGTFTQGGDLSGFTTSAGNDTNDSAVGTGYFAWSSGAFRPSAWTIGNGDSTAYSSAYFLIALRPFPVIDAVWTASSISTQAVSALIVRDAAWPAASSTASALAVARISGAALSAAGSVTAGLTAAASMGVSVAFTGGVSATLGAARLTNAALSASTALTPASIAALTLVGANVGLSASGTLALSAIRPGWGKELAAPEAWGEQAATGETWTPQGAGAETWADQSATSATWTEQTASTETWEAA